MTYTNYYHMGFRLPIRRSTLADAKAPAPRLTLEFSDVVL